MYLIIVVLLFGRCDKRIWIFWVGDLVKLLRAILARAAGSLVPMSLFTPPSRAEQLEAIGGSAPDGSEDLEETAEGWKATAWKDYPPAHREPKEVIA